MVNKRWFRFRSRLICSFQLQLQLNGTRARGRGGRRERGPEKWLILKEQRALFTQLQPPPHSHSPLSILRPPTQHAPSLLSPAPAERLTHADEKGSSVKGQRRAATPGMPAPVQSNKAGCPPVSGCTGGRTGPFLPLIASLGPRRYSSNDGWDRGGSPMRE